ncbi:MAG TPA: hypothetical protein VGM36_08020 [Rhizomicrobium sp.]
MADIIRMMTANVLPLEYASAQSMGWPQMYSAARSMMWLSVMSGLCVGVCFLSFTGAWPAHVLHIAIFGVTIFLAIRSGVRIARATGQVATEHSRRWQLALDFLAGLGLVVIGLGPLAFWLKLGDTPGQLILGLAFASLAIATPRHVMFYRFLASICEPVGRYAMARSLRLLGWFKSVYEAIWLGCCAITLLLSAARDLFGIGGSVADGAVIFAVAAFAGCLGFAGSWIWMMICHARLAQLAK